MRCLGSVLRAFLLLEVKPSAQSEVPRPLGQVYMRDISVRCSVTRSLSLKNTPRHDAATTRLHGWFYASDDQGLISSWHDAQDRSQSLFHQSREICFLQSVSTAFLQRPSWLSCVSFSREASVTLVTLPLSPDQS